MAGRSGPGGRRAVVSGGAGRGAAASASPRAVARSRGGGPRAGTGPGGRAGGPGVAPRPLGKLRAGDRGRGEAASGPRRPLPSPRAAGWGFPAGNGRVRGELGCRGCSRSLPRPRRAAPPPRPGGGGPGGKEPVPAPAAVPGVPACRDLGRRSRGLPWRAAAGSGAACGVWLLRVRRPPPQQGTASGAAGGAVPELLTPADASVLPGWRLGFALEERSGCRLAVSTSWF